MRFMNWFTQHFGVLGIPMAVVLVAGVVVLRVWLRSGGDLPETHTAPQIADISFVGSWMVRPTGHSGREKFGSG